MGTKNNPGPFDCYAKAKPDEPIFVLLARDPLAASVVRHWARLRADEHAEVDPKVIEAHSCAEAMEAWRRKQKADAAQPRDVVLLLVRGHDTWRAVVFDKTNFDQLFFTSGWDTMTEARIACLADESRNWNVIAEVLA